MWHSKTYQPGAPRRLIVENPEISTLHGVAVVREDDGPGLRNGREFAGRKEGMGPFAQLGIGMDGDPVLKDGDAGKGEYPALLIEAGAAEFKVEAHIHELILMIAASKNPPS